MLHPLPGIPFTTGALLAHSKTRSSFEAFCIELLLDELGLEPNARSLE